MRAPLPPLVCALLVASAATPATAAPGLPSRPANPTCVAHGRPGSESSVAIDLQDAFAPVAFSSPVKMVQVPGDPDVRYVVELPGVVARIDTSGPTPVRTDALDLQFKTQFGGELGFYSMALHPNFAANGEIFVHYIEQAVHGQSKPRDFYRVVSRFTSSDGGLTFPLASEEILIRDHHDLPQHMGGAMAFGSDGYLYVAFGEAGTPGNAQDTTNYWGAMLRLDVDGGTPYAIPPDNPLVSDPNAAHEIWAYGLRNPWQWSFDSATGDLWVGDVGAVDWEEVDLVVPGGNYGWPIREGAHCFEAPSCDPTGLTDPVVEYDHEAGCSITGGYVYRGTAIPGLAGVYVYADYCLGTITGVFDDMGTPSPQVLDTSPESALAFAQDLDGELYLLGPTGIRKIVPYVGPPPDPFPTLLSETGCFDPVDPTLPVPGLIPYDVQSALWSDGAAKKRWIGLPDGETIDVGADGDFSFPIGTVLVKEFSIGGQRVETRLFERHEDGGWGGYSFEWDASETDATLLADGKVELKNGVLWTFPSRNDCATCHTFAAGRALGPETLQLNRDFTYPSTGLTSNQLETYEAIGLFSAPLLPPWQNLEVMPVPTDGGALLDRRARSYLHANCSNCHRVDGPTPASIDFHYDTSNGGMNACDVAPGLGGLGLVDPRILAPGDASRSVMSARMHALDATRMPPLATLAVDAGGTALVDAWIDSWLADAGGCIGPDSDLDGLADGFETNTGTFVSPTNTGTDPGNADTDGDGVSDGDEVALGTDPNAVPEPPNLTPVLDGASRWLLVLALVLGSALAFRRVEGR